MEEVGIGRAIDIVVDFVASWIWVVLIICAIAGGVWAVASLFKERKRHGKR